MPFSNEGVVPGVALAVSGGGFRATLFHIGGLWRLNETGFLPRLDRISSISGGSITAGFLGLKFGQLEFDATGRATNLGPLVVDPLRAFCSKDLDVRAIGEGALLPWKKPSDIVEQAYRDHLFGDATLQDLPQDKPRFVINATNFATGVSFRFSRPYAGDYRIGLIPNPIYRTIGPRSRATFATAPLVVGRMPGSPCRHTARGKHGKPRAGFPPIPLSVPLRRLHMAACWTGWASAAARIVAQANTCLPEAS